MTERCARCRFAKALPEPDTSRCGWVDRTDGEAGDRMPEWAWDLLVQHPDAVGPDDRAESCPAYEAAA